jgi:hypothetical protein
MPILVELTFEDGTTENLSIQHKFGEKTMIEKYTLLKSNQENSS